MPSHPVVAGVEEADAEGVGEAGAAAVGEVDPGSSHALPIEKPDLVNRLILDFLAPQQADKLMPLTW